MKTIVISAVFLSLIGCASVNSVSLTPIPSQKGQQIKAEVSKWVILGLTFDNDFVDPLVDELKRKCPNGMVTGILTKDETISYVFVYKHNVVASGFCNGVKTAGNVNPRIPAANETFAEVVND